MRRISMFLAITVLCAGLTSGCGKKYVGETVNYNWEGWCVYSEGHNSGEKHCTVPSGGLIFDFTIAKGEVEHEYIIEGYLDPTQGDVKSWDRMIPEKSRFNMIVANDGVIIDNVSFRPMSAYGGLSSRMPFAIQYNSPEGFDAVCFYWNMYVRG